MSITHTTRSASVDEIAAEMDRRGKVIERLESEIARKNEVLTMVLDRLGIASRELTETHRFVLGGKVWGQTAMEAIRRGIEDADGLNTALASLAPQGETSRVANPVQVTDAEIKAFCERYREIFPGSHPDRQTIIELLTASKEAVSAASEAFRSTLTAAIGAGGQAVAVKALKWEEDRDDDGTEIHRTRGGEVNLPYTIYEDGFIKRPFGLSLNQLRIGSFDTVDEAKAAAQADYTRRILSALSQPHPADERVVEAKS